MFDTVCPLCNTPFRTPGSRGFQVSGEQPQRIECPSCHNYSEGWAQDGFLILMEINTGESEVVEAQRMMEDMTP